MNSVFRIAIPAVIGAGLLTAAPAGAQVNLTNQHVDIGLGFTAPIGTPGPGNLGSWELGFNDETNGVAYATSGNAGATDWAQGRVRPNTLTPRSSSPSFNFIGVPAGTPFYHLPAIQQPNRLFMGIGAEENDLGDPNAPKTYRLTDSRIDQPTGFDPDANLAPWIRLKLVGLSGPADGHFSIWSGNASAINQSNLSVNQVWMASSDGITDSDSLYVINGSHLHFNYGFTTPGTYDITFEASAFLGGTETNPTLLSISDPTTYRFIVEPIPEPSLLLLVAFGGVWVQRCRTRVTRFAHP